MIEELQLLNHYLNSKDPQFLRKLGIDSSYFITLKDTVKWVDNYRDSMGGALPTVATVASQFEDFKPIADLDTPEYLVSVLREQKAYMEYRPILTSNASLVSAGNTMEAMWKMRGELDVLLKRYNSNIARYDWVKNAPDRFDLYMEKHGKEGLTGITTGIKALDEYTGGWKDDDFILLAGRTNEGKSQVALYFAYMAWLQMLKENRNDPIVFFSTEMPKLEVSYRLDTLRGHFSNRALNMGKLGDANLYKEFLYELQKKNNSFLIMTSEENGGNQFTPNDIRAICESERPAMVFVDQLYDIVDGTGERDIRRRIVNVSNQMRENNLLTNTPTLVVAQASRDASKAVKKDPKASPDIDQIQESDNPAQKATRVLTLRYIDEVFRLSLKKNRGGKKDVDVYMRANIDTGMWDEVQEETLVF